MLRTLSTALQTQRIHFSLLFRLKKTQSGKLYSSKLGTSSLSTFFSSLYELSLCGAVYHAVQSGSTFESGDKILKCDLNFKVFSHAADFVMSIFVEHKLMCFVCFIFRKDIFTRKKTEQEE